MPQYLYTAWFRDTAADIDDQDYEWCACILISAESDVAAKHWGDNLAEGFGERHPDEQFLQSAIEPKATDENCDLTAVPRVSFGKVVTDEEIGW